MPSKILDVLLQEGFRTLKEEKDWIDKDYGVEVVKELGREPIDIVDATIDPPKVIGTMDVVKTLKVGIRRITCSECNSIRGGFLVGTLYEKSGAGTYSATSQRKEFPPFTPVRKVVDYVNSEEPLQVKKRLLIFSYPVREKSGFKPLHLHFVRIFRIYLLFLNKVNAVHIS